MLFVRMLDRWDRTGKKGAGAGNASDFGARVGGERSGYH